MSLNTDHKLKILHTIPGEDHLREEILIPVFQRMNRYKRILHVHGSEERGKDIVLVETDTMGDNFYTAVIVKRGDITHAVQPRRGRVSVANIREQVLMTINSGYECDLAQRYVKFSKIVVVTNGRISQSAQQELIKLANEQNFTNIQFKRDQDLLGWVDEYLPEYYRFQRASVADYVRRLLDRCERLDELKGIAGYDKERRLADVFIEPTLQMVKFDAGNPVPTANPTRATLSQLMFQKGHLLIVSGPGSGKSTLIRAQVQKLLNQNPQGQELLLPVLARASELASLPGETLEDILSIHTHEEYGDIGGLDIRTFLEENATTVFLFIDGLDEVPEPNNRSRLRELIVSFTEKYPKHKVVLTSRESADLETFALPNLRSWRLLPFQHIQITRFVQNWFGSDTSDHPLLRALQDHELLDKIPSTPLALTLLAILFDIGEQTEVPANLSELYKMFVDILVGKWNVGRRIDTFHTANQIESILQEIAVFAHENNLYSLTEQEIVRTVEQCNQELGMSFDPQETIEDLTERTGLLVKDGTRYEFRHLSFQEFLVATYYVRKPDEESESKLHERFHDGWWSPVAYFYCGLRRDTERLLLAIADRVSEYDLKQQMVGIWNLGYLIQSSYLTRMAVREDLVLEQTKLYAKCIEACLDLDNEEAAFLRAIPPGLLLLSFVEAFRIHYSSQFLMELHASALARLNQTEPSFGEQLALVTAAVTLAASGNPNALLDIYDIVSREPHINLVLQYHLNQLVERDHKTIRQENDLRKTLQRLRRNIRGDISSHRKLLELPSPRSK